MEKQLPSKLNDAINLTYEDESGLWLSSGLTLRRLVGILGMCLPILLWLYLYIDYGWKEPLESISHYYYTRAGTVFTIIVSLLAFFLIVYKGCEPIDFYLSLTAGVFALCVLLFPTSNLCDKCKDDVNKYCVTILDKSTSRELFHYISAGIFLLCLAGMSLFLFTKSNKKVEERTYNKIIRNLIYRACGVLMVICMLVIFFGGALELIPREAYRQYHITFWMEVLAVEAFGFSWLNKVKALIGD